MNKCGHLKFIAYIMIFSEEIECVLDVIGCKCWTCFYNYKMRFTDEVNFILPGDEPKI